MTTMTMLDERIAVICSYCRGEASPDLLAERWPFIAREMIVQNFDSNFLPILRPVFLSSEFYSLGPWGR